MKVSVHWSELLDAIPEPACLVTGSGLLVAANRSLSVLLGSDLEQRVGEGLGSFGVGPPEAVERYLALARRSRSPVPGAFRVPAADGSEQQLRCAGSVVHPSSDEEPAVLLFRFRTQESASERFLVLNEKVAELSREVRERVRAENALTEALERESAARASADTLAARMKYLAGAGRVLTSSLRIDRVCADVAQLCIGPLADYALVYYSLDLTGDKHVAVAHRDPERLPLLEQLSTLYSPSPDNPGSVISRVYTSGRSAVLNGIPDSALQSAARTPQQLEVMRALGAHAGLAVPMIAGGTTLGVIVCNRLTDDYTDSDVELAEELAVRAAHVLDGARLLREVSEARELLEEQALEMEVQSSELQLQADALETSRAKLRATNAELRILNERLREEVSEAERARAEAAEANSVKSQFLANMSHELRTPLNAIGGYVDLLEMELHGPIAPDQRQPLQRIRANQQRLLALINQLLGFAKLEAGQLTFHPEAFDVASLLDGVHDLVETQLSAKQIRYRCDEIDRELRMIADPAKAEQILLNLLSNAIKFSQPGKEVRIDCTQENGQVQIRVSDDGPGIPEDQLDFIFQPFRQAELHRTGNSEGTGLGLTISRQLARGMGGELSVESRVGRGSTFTLTLPSARGVRPEGAGPQSPTPPA